MKYIKNFENLSINTDKVFYKVKSPISEEELEILLFKLGENNVKNKAYVKTLANYKGDYFYLSIDKKEMSYFLRLSWMPGNIENFKYYKYKHSYTYGGIIKVTSKDIKEYNLYLDTKKYNL